MRKYTDKIKFFIKYLFVLRGILTTRGDGDFSFLCPRSPTPDQTQSPPVSPPEQKRPGSLPVSGRGPRPRPTLSFL